MTTDRVNSLKNYCKFTTCVSVWPHSKNCASFLSVLDCKKETANHAATQSTTMAHLIICLNCKRLVLSFLAVFLFFLPTLDKKRANF